MLDDVGSVMQGADIMIHPSVEEPFGIALLEGMRAGLPIVASRVGGIPEVVEDNRTARLVEPGDKRALATAVIDLLESPSAMTEYGRKGRERWDSKFRLEAMVDSIEKYLSSFVNN